MRNGNDQPTGLFLNQKIISLTKQTGFNFQTNDSTKIRSE